MRKMTAAEWLLASVAGRERATVVMGDLLEISANHGRMWFWAAYARTVLSLGWRSFAAFVCGWACFNFMVLGGFKAISTRLGESVTQQRHPGLGNPVALFLDNLVVLLCFVLPYAMVRFGLRDRTTLLASSLFLLAFPALSGRTWTIEILGPLCFVVIASAFLKRSWRSSMIALSTTLATLLVALVVLFDLTSKLLPLVFSFPTDHYVYRLVLIKFPIHHYFYRLVLIKLAGLLSLAIAAAVCSLLTRRLRQRTEQSGGAIA